MIFLDIKIRAVDPLDLPKVRQLWIAVGFKLSKSDSIPELQRMLKHNNGLSFVLENHGTEIIGCVLGGFDGRRGWVHHLAIKEAYQNSSYGTKLMSKLVTVFEEKKVLKIKLEILQSNVSVIEFYKKLGWKLRSELSTMSLSLE